MHNRLENFVIYKCVGLLFWVIAWFSLIPTHSFADNSIYEAQVGLAALGYDVGRTTGKLNAKTSRAFSEFCKKNDLPDDGQINTSDMVEMRFQARDKVRIPSINRYNFSPADLPLVITNTYKYEFPACADTFSWSRMSRTTDLDVVLSTYKEFISPNIYKSYPHWLDGTYEQKTVNFSDSVYNLHHRCLSGEVSYCKSIIAIVQSFSKAAALTENYDPTENRKNPELYFISISRILIPLLISYSSAIQIEGLPDNHEEIGKWAYSAIIQNTYDPYRPAGKRTRDFFRDELKGSLRICPDIRAQGHSIQSAYLIGIYGAVWRDPHMFSLAFDSLQFTLASIDRNGALPCEAMRGAVALFYSGSVLSNILQIIYLGELHGIGADQIKNSERVHKAALFLIRSAQDPKLIQKYAKVDFGSWCYEDYRHQCIDTPFGRMGAFGWIRLYRLLFPDTATVKVLDKLSNEMATADGLSDDRKIVLGAILKSSYPTAMLLKNITSDRSDLIESSTTVYEDSIEPNRGSPYCLYSLKVK